MSLVNIQFEFDLVWVLLLNIGIDFPNLDLLFLALEFPLICKKYLILPLLSAAHDTSILKV